MKDTVLQNGAKVVAGLLQLAAQSLHSLSLAVVPDEQASSPVPVPDPALSTAPAPVPVPASDNLQQTDEQQIENLAKSMEGGKKKKSKSKTQKTHKKSSKSKRSKRNNSKKNKSK